MTQKDESSNINHISTAPLFPALPLRPCFTFDVSIFRIRCLNAYETKIDKKQPTIERVYIR